jgi:hypothetical protein
VRRSGSAPMLPWRAWWQTLGSPHRPFHCHGRTKDEKSVGGGGASLIVDGVTTGLSRLVLARAELGVESD